VILPKAALTVIFDECDRFDHDETGGRIIGTFSEDRGKLILQVTGIIEPGPNAERSPVMLFQDGEYQERVFRKVEDVHPEIEHLGTWHTHHVNGLQTLSDGDITTYRKTVNHHNHNTHFFYALLVVAKRETKEPQERYRIKHYIFRRDDERVYEIPSRQVEIIDTQLVWPLAVAPAAKHTDYHPLAQKCGAKPERVYDRDILAEFYPGVRPFTSPKLGFYWRGPIELSDGSRIQIVLLEDSSSRAPSYTIVLRDAPDALKETAEHLAKQEFPSARAALIATERSCNRVLNERRVCDVSGGII
jgi:hypothetical protein